METYRMIIINDVLGYKLKSMFEKFLYGGPSHSAIPVQRGELLVERKEMNDHFNYQLYRDSSVCLFCTTNDVAPLSYKEFALLETIKKPVDILDTFYHKLEWGMQLQVGSRVNVTVNGPNLAMKSVARSTVHYRGPIGTQPGTYFGVELLSAKHHNGKFGTTDGTFQDARYFTCEDGCGLFVSLELLSPVDSASERIDNTKPKVSRGVSFKNGGKKQISSKLSIESGVISPPPKFSKGQRVSFHDNFGEKHCGTVEWSGRSCATRTFPYTVVGIRTDDSIFNTDYDGAVPGMSYLMRSISKRHVLFLPEPLLDAVIDQTQNVVTPSKAEKNDASGSEQARIVSEDTAALLALVAAEESLEIPRQQKASKRYNHDSESREKLESEADLAGMNYDAHAAHNCRVSSVDVTTNNLELHACPYCKLV